jgi:methionyl-tRNA formyltransferase
LPFILKFLLGETKGVAELFNVPVHHTPSKAKTLKQWQLPTDKQYDLAVVVSFGYFIPPHIISRFRLGAINVHPSLLPKYRGAAPIQHAILNGDRKTGVTVQELDEREFDAGRILNQKEVVMGIIYRPL